MKNWGRFGAEGRKGIYTERWGIEDGNNPVTSWYTGSRTWRKMKDNRVGNKELLVARSDKECGKICGGMWYISEDEE